MYIIGNDSTVSSSSCTKTAELNTHFFPIDLRAFLYGMLNFHMQLGLLIYFFIIFHLCICQCFTVLTIEVLGHILMSNQARIPSLLLLKKKNKMGEISLFYFNIYHKTTEIKTMRYWQRETHRLIEQNRYLKNSSTQVCLSD